jgi:AcrR family transcriptional regulator
VANTLFTQRGFASVSMRDIFCEAGVTAPPVYYNLKEALFDAVVRGSITMIEFSTQRIFHHSVSHFQNRFVFQQIHFPLVYNPNEAATIYRISS